MFDRIKKINNKEDKKGNIVYLMSRDQRVDYNYSLLYARYLAKKYNSILYVIYSYNDEFLKKNSIKNNFLIKGLIDVSNNLKNKNIPFYVFYKNPLKEIPKFLKEINAKAIVTDLEVLNFKKDLQNKLNKKINIPFYIVDTHNIVPVFLASKKEEYAAYTIRPKIKYQLNKYLTKPKKLEEQKINKKDLIENNLEKKIKGPENKYFLPTRKHALKNLNNFIKNKLKNYNNFSNDPTKNILSNMSIYLNFGQISSLEITNKILHTFDQENIDTYLEQLIIRKELADNFCYYNKNYDNSKSIRTWAKKSLEKHKSDKKEFIYSYKELENSKTHDEIWNAAQRELITKNKLHGYLRMYWAKKILEWSKDYKKAIEYAINLNDKYSLDGRDPNGYVGILWSIGGVHDRAFKEREIYGKIRYMSYNGLKRKFDIKKYIEKNN